jgi:UDP-glucose 4-epimerase
MILITGASGFIGGVLSDYLEQEGLKIRRASKKKLNKKYFQLDLKNSNEIEAACKGVNTVIHLASLDHAQSERNLLEAKEINFHSTIRLYEEAVRNKASKFIYFSTAHVYGKNLKNIVNEKTKPEPLSNYAITHYMAEEYLLKNAEKNETEVIVLRLSNIVGNPDNKNLKTWKYVANDLCIQAYKDKKIELISKGFQKRDFYSLENLLFTIKNIIKSKNKKLINEVFNLGEGKSISIIDLAKIIKVEYKLITNSEINIYSGDKDELSNELDYQVNKIKATETYCSDISINISIRNILNYYKNNF